MKRTYLILSIIILFTVVIFSSVTLFLSNKTVRLPIKQKVDGIEVISPQPNQIVSSPLKITGTVNGNGWVGFEGQVGTVKLLDGNGKELASTYLGAITEWMELPTSFSSTLEFKMPDTLSGQLLFRNENASGEPIRDKTFSVPVKFK